MSFAVKLDENLSRAHVDLLRQAGYDADRVHEKGSQGLPMSKYGTAPVSSTGCSLRWISIFRCRRYEPGTHPGIPLIRARSRGASAVAKVLARVIAERSLDDLSGCFAVADESFTRIRRPPLAS